MTGKAQRPPERESWVKLPRDLLSSEAWCAMGINERRLLDFLMIEQMAGKGRTNGRLLAPWNQLVRFGIGRRFIAEAVNRLHSLGLVDCIHGTGRAPNRYALTWLDMSDGSEPSNRWRSYRLVAVHEGEPQKIVRLVHEGEPHRCTKVNHKGRSGAQR